MYPHKWLLAAFFVLQTTLAYAGCPVGALPFNLQNNTLADATQVMGNFNQIVNGAAANCAASGANSDITSLSALGTPLSPAQGGSPVFSGGLTAGSANAQTMTTQPAGSISFGGATVTGHFGFTNTGPMTLSINGGPNIPVWRKQQFGVSSTQAGEAIVGHPFVMVYDQINNHLLLTGETIYIGELKTYMVGNGSIPPGWLLADGSSFVCTTFQDLCNVIGTTFGGTAANPNTPDTRGRVMTGLDNYFTNGAAGRLNNIITGCGTSFSTLGVTCANASERHFQAVNELAVHNHGITDPGHGHTVNDPGHSHTFSNTVPSTAPGAAQTVSLSGSNLFLSGTQSATTGITNGTNTTGITVNNTGSGAAMPIVNPNLGVVMIIRF